MDTTELKGKWNEVKGKLKQKYADLTDDDLLFFIKKQLAEREFYYNKADIIIKNENIDLKELAELVSDK